MDTALHRVFDDLLEAVGACRTAEPSQPALMPHGVVCTHANVGPRVDVRRDDVKGPLPSNGHQALAREQARRDLEAIWTKLVDLMGAHPGLTGVAESLHFVANGQPNSWAWVFSRAPFIPQRIQWTTTCGVRATLRELVEGAGPTKAYGFFDQHAREWMGATHTNLHTAGVVQRLLETQRYGGPNPTGQRVIVGELAATAPSPTPRSTQPWSEHHAGIPPDTGWAGLVDNHKACIDNPPPSEDGLLLEHGDTGTEGFFLLGNVGDPLGQVAEDWIQDGGAQANRVEWWGRISMAWESFWATAEALAPVVRRAPGDPVRTLHTLSRANPNDRLGIACLGGTLWDPLDLQAVAHLQPGPAWWVRHRGDLPTLQVRAATAQDAATTAAVFLMEGCRPGKTIEVWKPID
jgi:hypothetical protein